MSSAVSFLLIIVFSFLHNKAFAETHTERGNTSSDRRGVVDEAYNRWKGNDGVSNRLKDLISETNSEMRRLQLELDPPFNTRNRDEIERELKKLKHEQDIYTKELKSIRTPLEYQGNIPYFLKKINQLEKANKRAKTLKRLIPYLNKVIAKLKEITPDAKDSIKKNEELLRQKMRELSKIESLLQFGNIRYYRFEMASELRSKILTRIDELKELRKVNPALLKEKYYKYHLIPKLKKRLSNEEKILKKFHNR